MTATQCRDTDRQTWTARVAVRIPRDGGNNLASDTVRRLQRQRNIQHVEIIELCGIEPALAATIAQFEIRIAASETVDENRLRKRLADAAGTERVEGIAPVE